MKRTIKSSFIFPCVALLCVLLSIQQLKAQNAILNFYNQNGNNCLNDVSFDNDAAAFICATGITDATQKSAINRLVKDLKGYYNASYSTTNIWSKFVAIYPMVGGTATMHKYNLRNPNKFQLTFNGTWTHSSTGAKPTSGTTYATTGIIPSKVFTINDTHESFYSRTQVTEQKVELGNTNGGATEFTLYVNFNTLGQGIDMYNTTTGAGRLFSNHGSTSQGFALANRVANNDLRLYWNGTQTGGTNTGTSIGTLNTGNDILISNFSTTNATYASTKECAFVTIGSGLTSTEITNLYNAVQAFETTLSRQV